MKKIVIEDFRRNSVTLAATLKKNGYVQFPQFPGDRKWAIKLLGGNFWQNDPCSRRFLIVAQIGNFGSDHIPVYRVRPGTGWHDTLVDVACTDDPEGCAREFLKAREDKLAELREQKVEITWSCGCKLTYRLHFEGWVLEDVQTCEKHSRVPHAEYRYLSDFRNYSSYFDVPAREPESEEEWVEKSSSPLEDTPEVEWQPQNFED